MPLITKEQSERDLETMDKERYGRPQALHEPQGISSLSPRVREIAVVSKEGSAGFCLSLLS